jgi:photosystem II stability/assembly factor-like uncharacterized protein
VDGGTKFEPKVNVGENLKITKSDILSLSFLPPDPNRFTDPADSPGVFAGTINDGLFKTTNGGDLWEHFDFPPQKIYSFMTDHRDPSRMFATGVVENRGKIFRSKDGGKEWEEKYAEPGTGTVIVSLAEHPRETDVLYAGTSAGTVVKSVDGGDTWKNIGNRVDGPVTGIDFDATEKDTVYLFVFEKKLYYSPNGGAEWQDWEELKKLEAQALRKATTSRSASTGTPAASTKAVVPKTIVSILPDPKISGTIYAGTKTGLFRSKDYGKNWEEVNIIESAKKFAIRAIAVSPIDSNEVIFTSGKAFYKSINGGETWAVSQLPIDREVSVIRYDPFNARTIFFGLRNYK